MNEWLTGLEQNEGEKLMTEIKFLVNHPLSLYSGCMLFLDS